MKQAPTFLFSQRPPCIKALYGIPPAYLNDNINALGLYEDGDYWDQKDLNLFFRKYAPNVPQGTSPEVDSIDGGISPKSCYSGDCSESMLDLDMAFSLIYPQSVVVYQVDDGPTSKKALAGKITGYLNTFLDAVSKTQL